jgi:hypothetical protein
MKKLSLLLCLLAAFALAGCSFSYSSKTLSKSSSSPSKSSSGDDQEEKEYQQTYENEVMLFTDNMVHTQASANDFYHGLARIAERHGISDWETLESTYIAVGKGLKKAGLDKARLYTLPLIANLMSPRPKMMKYILQGYDS